MGAVAKLKGAKAVVADGLAFLTHRARRTTYAEYYAKRMDRVIKRNPAWGLDLRKRFQLDYLVEHGLRPGSMFLDYGCGALAAGVLFIDYLGPDRYVGVDISDGVLEEGRHRVAERSLEGKRPTLFRARPGAPAPPGSAVFDVVWAQSVFTHMPPRDIRQLLTDLRPRLHTGSVFYATFARGHGEPRQRRFKDWYYDPSFFEETARDAGYRFEIMADWKHPDDPAGTDTLAAFTLDKDWDRPQWT